jgi:hypothetical protein
LRGHANTFVPTQPPIQWAPGALSPVEKWQEHEIDHSPPSSTEVRNVELYLHSPICLHGISFMCDQELHSADREVAECSWSPAVTESSGCNFDTADGSNCNCESCNCKSEWNKFATFSTAWSYLSHEIYPTRDNMIKIIGILKYLIVTFSVNDIHVVS